MEKSVEHSASRTGRPARIGGERLRFVLCGGEADGKSTLLHRLLEGCGTPSRQRSANVVAWRFETGRRRFVAIDPCGRGHGARDILAGAQGADLAVLVVDAAKGVAPETRRHGYVAALAGLRRPVLAVNKMDLVDYDPEVFAAICGAYGAFARELGIDGVRAVPLSALSGENVRASGDRTPWYDGPTLLDLLQTVEPRPRGGIAGARASAERADQFAAHLLWLDEAPMLPERPYGMRSANASAVAQVTDLAHRIDLDDLGHLAAKTLASGEIGYCKIALDAPAPLDDGAFVLTDRFTGVTVGAGRMRFALRRAGNIAWEAMKVDKAARSRAIGQEPCILWLTGLPGAGKSTVADRLEQKLQALGRHTYVLDGNNLRHGLNRDLGFTDRDRVENIRRVAEVARLMVDAGLIVVVSLISPFRSERRMAREMVEEGEFLEIFVDTPIEICEARDPKGLYAKARRGELANFTGIDSPYEPPEAPDLRIDTTELAPDEAAEAVLGLLGARAPSRRID